MDNRIRLAASASWLVAVVGLVGSADADIVGHWKLDEHAANSIVVDSSPNGHNGILRDETQDLLTQELSVVGKVGPAVDFRKAGFVDLSEHRDALYEVEDFTLSLWLRCDGSRTEQCFFSWSNGTLFPRIQIQVHQGRILYGWNDGSGSSTAGTFDMITSARLTWAPNDWHHVAIVLRKSTLTMYRDGRSVGSATRGELHGLPILVPKRVAKEHRRQVFLGKLDYGRPSHLLHFTGAIDDVRLSNEASSAEQIRQLVGEENLAVEQAVRSAVEEDRAAKAAAHETSSTLPMGKAPPADMLAHFPDRMHAFVWRNWHAVEPEKIAEVLGTSVDNITAVAESMGLPSTISIPAEQRTRGYFWMTMCRRNWHVASAEQLAALLSTTPEELANFLRVEEHANWVILGGFKPACEPLHYEPPNPEAQRRAAEIKRGVEEQFGKEIDQPGEPRFEFVRRLGHPRTTTALPNRPRSTPRFVCSYLKIYGDPLLDPNVDMYPEGLLQRLAEVGVNGVWLYGVLRQLAPGGDQFPEFGRDWETRQANLRTLVERAKQYGIGVYLYINEPRAMPLAFFHDRPELAGVRGSDGVCMCTSHPVVRDWMRHALAHLFSHVPDLAGVFTITASENQTNCAWGGRHAQCPRCGKRTAAEIIAEVNATIAEGVRQGNPEAKVIAWDWGWFGNRKPDEIIPRLPESVWLMSVSEWSKPIERGGVPTTVGEYSVSAVGPGPRATHHWMLAKEAGLRTVAKVQLNSSWELSSLPYLPVLDLVAEHCHNLAQTGVDGMMLSWSLGGYPSPNLKIAHRFSRSPTPSVEEALDAVALDCFGPDGAPHARKAWTAFSKAFGEYPYHIRVLYLAPVQLGPANLLYPSKTGWQATMVGFPYDDLTSWRGPYPPEIFAAQFEKTAVGWEEGLAELKLAAQTAPAERRSDAEAELIFARAARLYFQSVANQTRFVVLQDALADNAKPLSPDARAEHLDEIRRVLQNEMAVAREMFTLAQLNSCVGYEAASQYFYLPLDLAEKVVNCRWLLDQYAAESR